jgi:hypothetical protein
MSTDVTVDMYVYGSFGLEILEMFRPIRSEKYWWRREVRSSQAACTALMSCISEKSCVYYLPRSK